MVWLEGLRQSPQSVMGSERLTGALLDRLTHRVHIFEANGQRYRLRESKKRLLSKEENEKLSMASNSNVIPMPDGYVDQVTLKIRFTKGIRVYFTISNHLVAQRSLFEDTQEIKQLAIKARELLMRMEDIKHDEAPKCKFDDKVLEYLWEFLYARNRVISRMSSR